MPDLHYEHARLVSIYDALDPDRSDLVPYLAVADELGARSVVDLGCGTGVLALLLADRGLDVTGVDPAAGSLAVARAKPGAHRVRWVHGDATVLAALAGPLAGGADLVTMTGNAAQAITDPTGWAATLGAVRDVLRPGGHLVLETRDPARRAWREWTRAATRSTTDVDGVGAVEHWVEVADVSGPLVSFRTTYVFAGDGAVLVSDSTLRFRTRDEVEADLAAAGLHLEEVRDAPDRPGRELVFVARRPATS